MMKSSTVNEMAGTTEPFTSSASSSTQRLATGPAALLCFLRGFLAHPGKVASVIPSSGALQRQLSSLNCIRQAETVVELGPGTGSTTHALLEGMQPSSRLLGVELVPEFVDHLRRIPDRRFDVAAGSALQLQAHLTEHHMPPPDVIVSGIPFSTLPEGEGRQLVESIYSALTPGGQFIAYQLRDEVSTLAGQYFGSAETTLVLWNIPPLRIYRWTKAPV